MRLTSLLLLVITSSLTAGCLGEVGASRKPGTGSGSGSADEPPAGACKKIEKAVTIRVPADMELLPRTGCYDIVGKLTIQSAQITSLAAMKDLTSVSELELDHTGITTVDFAKPVNLYGALTVTGNAALKDLKQLQFATPPSDVLIDDNAALATLDPFVSAAAKLTEVSGDVTITGNGALPAIPMPNLTKVTGKISIAANASVTSIDLSRLATTRGVELAENPQLFSVTGLAATEIAGDLAIRKNDRLTLIGLMGALVTVSGNVTIDSNAALVNLAMFTLSMKRIGQALTITNNASLIDLGMLRHLDSVQAITITNNRNLVACRAAEIDRCVVHTVGSVITGNRDVNCSTSCN